MKDIIIKKIVESIRNFIEVIEESCPISKKEIEMAYVLLDLINNVLDEKISDKYLDDITEKINEYKI